MTAIVSLLSLNSQADNTNKIEINQVASGGENLVLSIDQIGYDNKVFFSLRFVGEIQVGDNPCRMRKLQVGGNAYHLQF